MLTPWEDMLPEGWDEEDFAPFERAPWFRAQFLDRATRCDRLVRRLADLPRCDDPAFADCRFAIEQAVALFSRKGSSEFVSELVSDAHHAAVMAQRLRPSRTMTAFALVPIALPAPTIELGRVECPYRVGSLRRSHLANLKRRFPDTQRAQVRPTAG